MAFELPPLPFDTNALAARRHVPGNAGAASRQAPPGLCHGAERLRREGPGAAGQVAGRDREGHRRTPGPVFNNAGQHWNHILFWKNLSPNGGKIPGKLQAKIDSDLGGTEKFKEDFKAAATTQFGSGWAWLVLGTDGKLKVTKTPNGSNPLATGEGHVLLALDVWEHSYYLDFRNRRPDYMQNYLDKLANYEFAEAQLLAA